MHMPDHLSVAEQRIGVANHLLTRTYPMVNDSRILLAVAKELNSAAISCVDGLLAHEYATRRIPALVKNIDSRLELFEEAAVHYGFDAALAKAVRNLHEVITLHERAPVEFSKPDRFVICDKEYKVTTVTVDMVKQAMAHCRSLASAVRRVSEDGRIAIQRQS
jgi:hypothetical protein